MIIYSPNPTFVPSLSEIGDLSCITSCLVLPGSAWFSHGHTLKIKQETVPVEELSADKTNDYP